MGFIYVKDLVEMVREERMEEWQGTLDWRHNQGGTSRYYRTTLDDVTTMLSHEKDVQQKSVKQEIDLRF